MDTAAHCYGGPPTRASLQGAPHRHLLLRADAVGQVEMASMNSYEMLGVIGQGQYGTASKAKHKQDGQLYCVKRIPMSAKDDHKGALAEADLLSKLDHPNIIGYKESFVDKDGSLCIITTFCEEGDLFTKIRKKAAQKQYFTESEIMDMFLQTASAVQYIHSKKVLHRDLKTQNIFIAKGGIVKLGDFGISKVLEKTDQFATTVTGTPYYMAPEICTNQPYTYKSDIWSLGCVLYELCTLKHAFAADSLLSLVYQIVRGNFPPIPTDHFSKGLSDLVNSLLVRDANQRPSLGQVFKAPYVVQHTARFQSEQQTAQQRTLNRQSESVARRNKLLDGSDISRGPEPQDGNVLTPKQRIERKKDEERRRRELELKVASVNMNKDREQAAARKKEQIYTSNVGLAAGQRAATPPVGSGGFEDDDAPNMGTMPAQSRGRQASANIWDVDRAPPPGPPGPSRNAAIYGVEDDMPAMGTMPTHNRLQGTSRASNSLPAGGHPGAGNRPSYAQRPSTSQAAIGGTKPASRGGNGAGVWGVPFGNEDDVLMGSMSASQPRTGVLSGGIVDPYGATVRSGPPAGRMQSHSYGAGAATAMDDDMVNMGTMQMTQGRGMAGSRGYGDSVLMGSVVSGAATTRGGAGGMGMAGTRGFGATAHSDMVNMGSVNFSTRSGAAQVPTPSAGGPVISGGYRFGAADDERSASPFAPPKADAQSALGMDRSKIKFGAASESKPRGSFAYDVNPQGRSAAATHVGRSSAAATDEDDGYSDDFEPEDSGDEVLLKQRDRIIKNVQDMASFDDESKGSIALVKEQVSAIKVNDKAKALRERCTKALGPKFNNVYDYLKRARAASTDEKEVQRQLLAIVGDKALMPGCFCVDQLVFTETMFQ